MSKYPNNHNEELEGYIDKYSYSIDESINLRLSIPYKKALISIYYYFNGFENSIHSFECDGNIQNKNKLSFAEGCKWEITTILKIQSEWKHGLYIIKIQSENNNYFIPFIIKNIEKTDFVILMNTNTWEAYNKYGGASYYRYMSKDASKYGNNKKLRSGSSTVSYNRPNSIISFEINNKILNYGKNIRYKSHLFYGEMYLIEFIHNNNYSYSLITDIDLHNNYPIQNYKSLILNCHPEYWSSKMVTNVIKNSNNIISLAGNVSYRKINITSSNMIKNNLWNPITLLYISGSYFTDNDDNTYSPYQIINKNSWIFNGIKINSQYFGKISLNNDLDKNGCSGHELDKCIINKNFIIAKGINIGKNNKRGGGDILFFTIKNKKIFSVGSIVFTGGIYTDNVIKNIVINVLNKFKI
jgi:N,N-dimethylformamidase